MSALLKAVMVGGILVISMCMTSQAALNNALAYAQRETPAQISNPIVRGGTGMIPERLLKGTDISVVAPDGDVSRKTLGGQADRVAQSMSGQAHGILGVALRLVESLVLLYPLRLAVLLPYFLIMVMLFVEIGRASCRETV